MLINTFQTDSEKFRVYNRDHLNMLPTRNVFQITQLTFEQSQFNILFYEIQFQV